jgi:hypothetical protein
MKHHFSNLAQVLAGLLIGTIGLAVFFGAVLPLWIAQYVSAVMVLGFLFCLTGIAAVLLMLAGMVIQEKEHAARIMRVLTLAREKVSGRRV